MRFTTGLILSALLFCGCVKVTRLERPIAAHNEVFENEHLAIDYPEGWVITNEPPFWIYDPQNDFKPAVIGEREIYTFRDPYHQDYAVWINLDRSRPDGQGAARRSLDEVLREAAARYRFFLKEENYAEISEKVRPVVCGGREGLELTVSGLGKKKPASVNPIAQGFRSVQGLVKGQPAPDGERAKEYHVILLELDNTMVRLHFVLLGSTSPGVRERLRSIVHSLRLKAGFRPREAV